MGNAILNFFSACDQRTGAARLYAYHTYVAISLASSLVLIVYYYHGACHTYHVLQDLCLIRWQHSDSF